MSEKKSIKKRLLNKLLGLETEVENKKKNLNNGSYLTNKKTKTDQLDEVFEKPKKKKK